MVVFIVVCAGKRHKFSDEVHKRFNQLWSVRVDLVATHANIDKIFAKTQATNAMGELTTCRDH